MAHEPYTPEQVLEKLGEEKLIEMYKGIIEAQQLKIIRNISVARSMCNNSYGKSTANSSIAESEAVMANLFSKLRSENEAAKLVLENNNISIIAKTVTDTLNEQKNKEELQKCGKNIKTPTVNLSEVQ